MFKAIALGLSATTNMVLIGVGGAVAGMAALKGVQVLRNPKVVEVTERQDGSKIIQPAR